MSEIFESDNYAVYRMYLPAGRQRYQVLPVPLHGKLTVGE